MATMRDVVGLFESETGLDWYPDPAKTTKSVLLDEFVTLTEEVIAAQARATGQQHVAAEGDRDTELKGEAIEAFAQVQQWVANLSEDQRADLRKFNHVAV